ncbi:DNA-directed RNA polymerase II subunit GRINL1A-like [Hoplias malabaricus]|uniref:DNA-directed RNA polymerase II subunit GRINL1A-like n=1 Tax=Hoplias malabaricus TaxID=27720 RepID=UPI003462DAEE
MWGLGGLQGELSSRSREQLLETLSRQEKLLSNKRFIQTLPDKGKKINEFVEKVRQALKDLEEEEKKKAGLSAIGTEFQAKYQQAFTQRRHVASDTLCSERGTLKNKEQSVECVNPSDMVGASSRLEAPRSLKESTETLEASSRETASSLTADGAGDTDLTEVFKRLTLSEENTGPSKNSPPRNPFSATQSQKKLHYIDVLEKSETNVRKARYKPNQLPLKSGSSSPGQSSGSTTPLSAEARRQRDRKHLDDITAAKLPPLHHSPAQLLSLEESVTLLQEQTRKQQELQAKLAAQKLADGLTISMSSYNPEGGTLATYKEMHDDVDLSDVD